MTALEIIQLATGRLVLSGVIQTIRVHTFTLTNNSISYQIHYMEIFTAQLVLVLNVCLLVHFPGTCSQCIFKRKVAKMSIKKWLLTSAALLISVVLIVTIANAVSPEQNLIDNSVMGLQDTTPVGWINDRPISRGALAGLANTYVDLGTPNKEVAYQKALNLLVQNTLFLQEATRKGLLPTDQEVDVRVQELLDAARDNNQQLREMYIAQAGELGIPWDSPEFVDFLKKTHKEIMPVEKLNRQLLEQVNGDTQQFTAVKVQLLSELISTANIRLDATTLPDEAKEVHIPQLSEFPLVTDVQVEPLPTP